MSFSDRLEAAVRSKQTALCVGLDPRWESLPKAIREAHQPAGPEQVAAAFAEFSCRVIDLVAPLCGVVKPQSAFFEMCGPAGLRALGTVLTHAKSHGLLTILDAKRGDIATTATAYAEAAFDGPIFDGKRWPICDADSLTVNPYLGRDAIEPFLKSARRTQRGVFVLVRTSNPGAGLFQDLDCGGQPLYRHVANEVASWSRECVGANGLGDVGAVVGATCPAELAELRQAYPDVWFLVPGYGAQGGTAADVRAAFRSDGLGAIVNSSRGVTFPFTPDDPDWQTAIVSATRRAVDELRC